MGGLGGERARWSEFAKDLTAKMVNVVGDVALSSGIIAYLGAFTSGYRQRCVDAWSKMLNEKGIGTSAGFMLTTTLGDPVQVCTHGIDVGLVGAGLVGVGGGVGRGWVSCSYRSQCFACCRRSVAHPRACRVPSIEA